MSEAVIEPRRIFGGRYKPLGPARAEAMKRLPEFEIDLNGAVAGTLAAEQIFTPLPVGRGWLEEPGEGRFENLDSNPSPSPHPSALRAATFSLQGERKNKVHLEIGCGTGEHITQLAREHPDDLFLAAEPFRAGVANMMRIVTNENIPNIRIYPSDGFALLRAIAPQSIDYAYLLFPDPWPKKRHHHRRFLQDETLREFTRVVRTGGSLLLASDDPGMQAWMHEKMTGNADFIRQAASPHQPQTRYATKAIAAGRSAEYLYFIRK